MGLVEHSAIVIIRKFNRKGQLAVKGIHVPLYLVELERRYAAVQSVWQLHDMNSDMQAR